MCGLEIKDYFHRYGQAQRESQGCGEISTGWELLAPPGPKGKGKTLCCQNPGAGEVVNRCGLGRRDAATVDKGAHRREGGEETY